MTDGALHKVYYEFAFTVKVSYVGRFISSSHKENTKIHI